MNDDLIKRPVVYSDRGLFTGDDAMFAHLFPCPPVKDELGEYIALALNEYPDQAARISELEAELGNIAVSLGTHNPKFIPEMVAKLKAEYLDWNNLATKWESEAIGLQSRISELEAANEKLREERDVCCAEASKLVRSVFQCDDLMDGLEARNKVLTEALELAVENIPQFAIEGVFRNATLTSLRAALKEETR